MTYTFFPNKNLIPGADNSYSIGSSSKRMHDGYFGRDIYADGYIHVLGVKFTDNSIMQTASSGSGSTPAGSTGAVQFNSSGALGADAAKFYWDNGAKKLAIGTATPDSNSQLTIFDASISRLAVLSDSNSAVVLRGGLAPGVVGYGSRGTLASPTALQSGDVLTEFDLGGQYSSVVGDFTSRSYIRGVATQNWSAGNVGNRLDFATAANGSATATIAMTIDQSHFVGIGTTAPTQNLDVFSTATTDIASRTSSTTNAAFVEVGNTSQGSYADMFAYGSAQPGSSLGVARAGMVGIEFNGNTSAIIRQISNTPLIFGTNDLERVRIDSSGNVGIGDSNPIAKLTVAAGAIAGRAIYATATINGTGGQTINYFSTTGGGTGPKVAMASELLSGYTSSSYTSALSAYNASASTATGLWTNAGNAFGNAGLSVSAVGSTTGHNASVYATPQGSSSLNAGVFALATVDATGANIGIVGTSRNTTGIQIGGFFGLYNSAPGLVSSALIADNADQTSPIFLARDNGTSVFTIADNGETTLAPIAGHAGNGLTITSGTISTTTSAMKITGTLPNPGATLENGVVFDITSTGSSNSAQTALSVNLGAGFTGLRSTYGILAANNAQGISAAVGGVNLTGGEGNAGVLAEAIGVTGGANIGVSGYAEGGKVSAGLYGFANAANASKTNIGTVGIARNTGASGIQVGGYFSLNTADPTYVSSALIADNGAETSPIFLARDNGTTVFSIIDGGNVGIGTTNPSQKLEVSGTIYSTTGGFKFPDGTTQTTAGTGIPGGSNTYVQYNNAGAFAGSAGLTYNDTTGFLTLTKNQSAGSIIKSLNTTSSTDAYSGLVTSAQNNTLQINALSDAYTRSYVGFHAGSVQLYSAATNGFNIMSGLGTGTAGTGTGYIRFITNNIDLTSTAPGNDANTRMVIDPTGNVGIGTTTPADQLHVGSSTSAVIRAQSTSATGDTYLIARNNNGNYIALHTYGASTGGDIGTSSGVSQANIGTIEWGGVSAAVFRNSTNTPMIFMNNDTQVARFSASGNMGIGNTSPTNKLAVGTDGSASLPSISLGTTDDPNTGIFHPAADTLAFSTNGTERFRIDSSGNVGLGTTTTNELLTVNGRASLAETTAPTATSGFGKLYASSTDTDLHFLRSDGYDLLISDYGIKTETYSSTTNLNLSPSLQGYRTVSLTGDITFTTSNRNAGNSLTIRIVSDSSSRTLTFPAWKFIGSSAPTAIAASKTAILSIVCFGPNDTDIVASYAVEP